MEASHYFLEAPTRQIRLLDLLPATPSGELQGRLRRVPIDHPPRFVTVSHVWGTGRAKRPIHLHSGCGSKTVQISPNLEAFLIGVLCDDAHSLPKPWEDDGERLPLWIDMTCINQSDMSEKAAQIPLMRDIYFKAQCVVVWINEYDSQLRYAFRYLRRLAGEGRANESKPCASFDPMGWDGIRHLMRCDWFSRRWTVQEAAISGTSIVLCGSEVTSMDDIFRGIDAAVRSLVARSMKTKLLKRCNTSEVRPVHALQYLKRAAASGQQLSLLWLLEHLRFTRATLAHDQVYSLLGLCDPRDVPGNPVRYDVEAEEAYKACVASHARVHGSLDFLALCTPAQRDVLTCGAPEKPAPRPFAGPSWVPNFHSANLRRCLGLNDAEREDFFGAASGLPVDFAFNASQLAVSGVFVDRIRVLGDFARSHPTVRLSDPDSQLYHRYFEFWGVGAEDPSPYPDCVRLAEAFIRTLTLLGVYRDPVPSPADIPALFYRWCKGSKLWDRVERCGVAFGDAEEGPEGKPFVAMKRLESWEPFITEEGYIGLAREGSCVGDEVWVIGGCRTPVLLSPREAPVLEAFHYHVKGEVFLDGFMFGELLGGESGARDSSIKPVVLV